MNFRWPVVVLVVLFLTESLLIVPEVWGPGQRFLAAVLPALVVDQTNIDRVSEKEPPLQINPLLAKAARLKAEDMAERSYFSHEGPNGEAPWIWLDKVGYKYIYAGENLALNFYESSEVNQAWMNSPKHRENILDKNFTDIGIGLANGKFEGRDSVFIVQFLGSTENSLAQQEKLPTAKLGFRRTNVLSAAIGLSDGILTKLRAVSLTILHSLGYSVARGRII